jgi:hypothetical protein
MVLQRGRRLCCTRALQEVEIVICFSRFHLHPRVRWTHHRLVLLFSYVKIAMAADATRMTWYVLVIIWLAILTVLL